MKMDMNLQEMSLRFMRKRIWMKKSNTISCTRYLKKNLRTTDEKEGEWMGKTTIPEEDKLE